jgi:hypothetical protein
MDHLGCPLLILFSGRRCRDSARVNTNEVAGALYEPLERPIRFYRMEIDPFFMGKSPFLDSLRRRGISVATPCVVFLDDDEAHVMTTREITLENVKIFLRSCGLLSYCD